jgi:hypothetical protein
VKRTGPSLPRSPWPRRRGMRGPARLRSSSRRGYPVGGTRSRCGSYQRAVMPQACGRRAAIPFGRLGHAFGLPAVSTLGGEVSVNGANDSTGRDAESRSSLGRGTTRSLRRRRRPNGGVSEVTRASNVRQMETEEYARRLYADGVKKGCMRLKIGHLTLDQEIEGSNPSAPANLPQVLDTRASRRWGSSSTAAAPTDVRLRPTPPVTRGTHRSIIL